MGVKVANTFTTDGINDGPGGAQDFQHFYLDSQFQNLYRVDIVGYSFSLDNVTVSGVPEPTSPSLLLLGAVGAIFYGRWRKRRDAQKLKLGERVRAAGWRPTSTPPGRILC
jgi:hypothetical protein